MANSLLPVPSCHLTPPFTPTHLEQAHGGRPCLEQELHLVAVGVTPRGLQAPLVCPVHLVRQDVEEDLRVRVGAQVPVWGKGEGGEGRGRLILERVQRWPHALAC
jgi:hypothetical protein